MKRKYKRRIYLFLILLSVVLIGTTSLYLSKVYKSEVSLESYDNKAVKIQETNEGIYIDSGNDNSLIVFYPGAQIEIDSYIPLLVPLAKEGISSFIVKMPLNLAVLDKDAFEKIASSYSYKNYYLMGHSLGGAMAADYTAENEKKIRGIILLAAYPTKKIESTPLLSIYGSEDGVLNTDKYSEYKKFWPGDHTELVIEGGNHSYFGNYGEQKGDRKASITREEQQQKTIKAIVEFINRTKK